MHSHTNIWAIAGYNFGSSLVSGKPVAEILVASILGYDFIKAIENYGIQIFFKLAIIVDEHL